MHLVFVEEEKNSLHAPKTRIMADISVQISYSRMKLYKIATHLLPPPKKKKNAQDKEHHNLGGFFFLQIRVCIHSMTMHPSLLRDPGRGSFLCFVCPSIWREYGYTSSEIPTTGYRTVSTVPALEGSHCSHMVVTFGLILSGLLFSITNYACFSSHLWTPF